MKKRFFSIQLFTPLLCILVYHASGQSQIIHGGFHQNADRKVNVYRKFGGEPGKTIMITDNIQGDEAGGYPPRDIFADIHRKKDNLIAVPGADFYSVLLDRHDGVAGDTSLKFHQNGRIINSPDKEISPLRQHLIAESGILLNLHRESVLYSPAWNDGTETDKRYGQPYKYDAEIYPLPAQASGDAAPAASTRPSESAVTQKSAALQKIHSGPRVIAEARAEFPPKSSATGTAPPAKKQQLFQAVATAASVTAAPKTRIADNTGPPQKVMPTPPLMPEDKQQIIPFVERWRQAWTSQEIEPYIAFYDETFESGGKNLAAWKAHKEKLNKKYTSISVIISDIKVSWTGTGAVVSFRQEYSSDRYSASGTKTLFLIYNDLGWKIKREAYSSL